MTPQRVPATTTSTTPGTGMSLSSSSSTSFDPSILSFGSNVAAKDDLRRIIQAEIEEIDKQSNHIRQSIHIEETLSQQLRTNQNHAHKEATNLLRGSEENLDASKVNQQILHSIRTSAMAEFVLDTMDDDHMQDEETVNRSTNVYVPENPSLDAIEAAIHSKDQKFKELQILLKQEFGKLMAVQAKVKGMEQSTKTMEYQHKFVDKDELRMAQIREETDIAEETLLEESRRFDALAATLRLCEEQEAAAEKEVRNMTNDLNVKANEHAAREAAWRAELEADEDKVEDCMKQITELQAEQAHLLALTESTKKTNQRSLNLIQAREETKRLHHETRKERLHLVAQKEDAEKALMDAKEELQEQEQLLSEKQVEAQLLAELEASHEQTWGDRDRPDRALIDSLHKESAELQAKIEALEKDTEVGALKEKLAAEELTLKILTNQNEDANKQVDDLQTQVNEQMRLKKELDQDVDLKLRALTEQIQSNEARLESELARIALEHEKCRQDRRARARDALDRKVEIFRYARALLEETAETERALLNLNQASPSVVEQNSTSDEEEALED